MGTLLEFSPRSFPTVLKDKTKNPKKKRHLPTGGEKAVLLIKRRAFQQRTKTTSGGQLRLKGNKSEEGKKISPKGKKKGVTFPNPTPT